MAWISSARVALSGSVALISASNISVESCCFLSKAVYRPAATACSISAPEKPSLAAASFGKSNDAGFREFFVSYSAKRLRVRPPRASREGGGCNQMSARIPRC